MIALRKTVHPFVLFAATSSVKNTGVSLGATKLRNRTRGEQHQLNRRARGKHRNDDDFREIQTAVCVGSPHVQTCAYILNLGFPIPVTPKRPPDLVCAFCRASRSGASVQNVSSRAVRMASIDSTLVLFGGLPPWLSLAVQVIVQNFFKYGTRMVRNIQCNRPVIRVGQSSPRPRGYPASSCRARQAGVPRRNSTSTYVPVGGSRR